MTFQRRFIVLLAKSFPVTRQIISSHETISREFRLDPSNYSKQGELLTRHIKQLPFKSPKIGDLPEFNEIYLPKRFARKYLDNDEYGFPMLGISSMLMLRLPVDTRIKINGDILSSPLHINNGDILVSRSGTVGTTVLCGESYGRHVASDHCFRVRLDKNIRGYVATYLQSVFGQTFMTGSAHGKVIKELKAEDITNIRIPLVNTDDIQRINDMALKAVKLIDDARAMIEMAEKELSNCLIQPNIKQQTNLWFNKESNSYIVNSSSFLNYRLDPHYYNPNIEVLRNHLNSLPHMKLGEIADVWGVARFKRYRADKGYGIPLYSSSDIIRALIKPSTFLSSKRNERNIKQCTIEEGTILVPCSGAYGGILGRCVYAGKTLHGKAVTQHVLRIKINDTNFNPYYVAALLGSLNYGYPIITALRHGKDVPEINPDMLKSFPIPHLTPKNQQTIGDCMRMAISYTDQANDLNETIQNDLLTTLKWTEEDL